MKLSILACVAAYAALTAAQSIPTCATTCVQDGIPNECHLDPKCICSSTDFITAISCCVYKACSPADQEATLAYAKSICSPAGVNNLPSSAGCSGAAASSTSSGASGSSTSGGSSVTTSSGSSSTGSSSNAVTSAAGSATSGAQSATSAAGSSASSATGNAAPGDKIMVQGMGALGAAMMGVAALL